MAYSGAQNTRLGLCGFSRGLYGSFAGKTEASSAERGAGVASIISSRGAAVLAAISGYGVGVSADISGSLAVTTIIQSRGAGVVAPISSTGQGEAGVI